MGASYPMSAFQQRLNLARMIFIVAAVLIIIAQFLPLKQGGHSTWHLWPDFFWLIRRAAKGHIDLIDLGVHLLAAFVHLFIIAAPFFVPFLSKARPLLWIARLLAAVVAVGALISMVSGRILGFSASLATGGILLGVSVGLLVPGLLLIPCMHLSDVPPSTPDP